MTVIKKINNLAPFSIFIIISLVMIPTSFLYQITPFSDVNTMIAMGRGLVHGQIPFVDLFEQRGPYMYLLHTVGALPGNALHWVYIIEIVNFYWLYRILIKIINIHPRLSIIQSKYYASFLITSYLFANAFFWGATPEEFVMVPTAYTMYVLLKSISDFENLKLNISKTEIFLIGLGFGWTVMLKFADIGIFVGFYFTIGIVYLFAKEIKKFMHTVVLAILGLLTAIAPVIIFYSAIGKLQEFLFQYFNANSGLSAYSSSELIPKFLQIIKLDMLYNASYFIFMGIPIIVTILKIIKLPKMRLQIIILSVLSIQFFMSLLIMRFSQAYTGPSIIAIITLLAWSAPSLVTLFQKSNVGVKIFLIAESVIIFIILATLSDGSFLRLNSTLIYQNPKLHMNKYSASYKQGSIIKKYHDKTIEAYGFVPLSIYENANTYPQLKYFDQTTVPYASQPIAGDSQYNYIKNKKATWVQTQIVQFSYNKKDNLSDFPATVGKSLKSSKKFNESAVKSITPKSDAIQQRYAKHPNQYYSIAYTNSNNKFSIVPVPPKKLISNYVLINISSYYDEPMDSYWEHHKIKQETALALFTTKENAKKHHLKAIPLQIIK